MNGKLLKPQDTDCYGNKHTMDTIIYSVSLFILNSLHEDPNFSVRFRLHTGSGCLLLSSTSEFQEIKFLVNPCTKIQKSCQTTFLQNRVHVFIYFSKTEAKYKIEYASSKLEQLKL